MEKKIKKALRHYKYDQIIKEEDCEYQFDRRYNFWSKKDNLNNYPHIIWAVLFGIPNSTHIKAKHLLLQGNNDCWKYFERTAVFWTYGHLNTPWIDHLKGVYEYALYVDRDDLIKMLFESSLGYLTDKDNLSNKEFKKQRVYPSTQLLHFLLEKYLGSSPVKDLILGYGTGYGIYQKIIDNWDDFSNIEQNYWDELCEYHLNGIGLQHGEKWENEEFLDSGLIPMELINLIKVRKKLGLDVPNITNALFATNMAKMPLIPTGYDEKLDLKFRLVELTVKTKKKYTFEDVRKCIRTEYGEKVVIFEG